MQEQNEKKPFEYRTETKEFAFRIINVYQYLNERAKRKEKVLSKQLLIAGTNIGERIRQNDYIGALGAATSTKYWLELLINGGYLNNEQSSELLEDSIRFIRYFYVIVHPESRKDKKEGGAE